MLEFETRLAALHLKAEERRDVQRTHNRVERAAFAPAIASYLTALGAGAAESVNVENPRLLEGLNEVVATTAPATLRAYLAFTVVRGLANALPAQIDDEDFEFYGRRIRGQEEPHERTKRVIDAIGEDLGEALAQRYVALNFPPEAKQRATSMVAAILEEMRASIRSRAWMGAQTRAQGGGQARRAAGQDRLPRALARVVRARDRPRVLCGQPAQREPLRTGPPAREAHAAGRPRGVGDARPHRQRVLPPALNEIVVPAGILQPPLFDADADDAVNFGGIGMVIAHEITHGFDDQGRRFDADGALREWWTAEDAARFTELAERLVAQFDAYTVLDGVAVNGRLTLGENIADLGGLALAQRAHARVAAGAPAIDGLTPAQRFFLANATLWRANISPDLQRTLAGIDPHSPRPLRVLGPISNLEAFQVAYGLADDVPIMRPPEDRIEIW